jgi:diacylglycerol kinase family enzyme
MMDTQTKAHMVFCFLNPLSCDGYSLKKWPAIERIFRELSIDCKLIAFEGDLRIAVERVLSECKDPRHTTFAGVGGDGTHCAIINGMMNFKNSNPSIELPFYSIIPLGTGNNIAKSFRLSRDDGFFSSELRRTIAGTIYGAEFKIDIGRMNGTYFLDAFTTGIDAHILTGRNRDRSFLAKIPLLNKILRGYPLYVINTIKSLGRCKHLECKVEVDGKIFYEGGLFNVIVNNTRIYAGEFDPTDNAIANDGLLDLALHTGRRDYVFSYLLSYRRLPRKIRRILTRHNQKPPHIKFKNAVISFKKNILAQIDGEEIKAFDKYELEIFPQAISLKIPVEPA